VKILVSEMAWSCGSLKNYCLAGVKARIKENKSRENNKAHPVKDAFRKAGVFLVYICIPQSPRKTSSEKEQ